MRGRKGERERGRGREGGRAGGRERRGAGGGQKEREVGRLYTVRGTRSWLAAPGYFFVNFFVFTDFF